MFPIRMRLGGVFALVLMLSAGAFALSNPNAPTSTDDAVKRIADRLVAEQLPTGPLSGAWPANGTIPAGTFTGTMAAGLAEAYWLTCDPVYKAAAEAAGDRIWNDAPGCSLFFDEAYAFMKLSRIDCNPADNPWRTALEDFYACLESQPPNPDYGNLAGTELFIAMIEFYLDPPFATFEMAYYTVVAYYVDAPDKAIWRDELIRVLETSNAVSGEQVFALGAATWALAQTGDLDTTAVFVGSALWGSFPGGAAYQLQQLPPLLASYQVPGAYPIYADHFYSVYNPPNVGFSGWTETNIYAVMGMDAAAESDSSYNFRSKIDAAWAVNMQPVDLNGDVWYNAIPAPGMGDNDSFYHYAGEYLQYLAAARLPGDINLDDSVDITDLDILALNWLGSTSCACNVADLNRDRKVNLLDFARLAQGWLLSR